MAKKETLPPDQGEQNTGQQNLPENDAAEQTDAGLEQAGDQPTAPPEPTGPVDDFGTPLVRMIRPESYPKPWTADVHPDMVEHYRRGGFVPEADTEVEG